MTEQWIYNGVEFRIGDRVKVVSDAASYDQNGMGPGVKWLNGWENAFNYEGRLHMGMDGYIGMEFEIEDISQEGVYFVGYSSENSYGFPLSSLINLTQRGNLPAIH